MCSCRLLSFRLVKEDSVAYIDLYCNVSFHRSAFFLISGILDVSLKADSHTAFRAHAAPISFPCHAVPLGV